MNPRVAWTLVAIGSVWVAVVIVSILAPNMVTGSEQDRLPIVLLLAWIPGAVATRMLLTAMLKPSTSVATLRATAITTAVIWAGVVIVSVLGPELVTGSDPTRIPVAAILAPIGGAVVTSFVGDLARMLVQGPDGDSGSAESQ